MPNFYRNVLEHTAPPGDMSDISVNSFSETNFQLLL